MKYFIQKVILFSLILLGVFYCLDKLVTSGLRQSNSLTHDNLSKLYNGKINADLIINGSSKAYVQVSPKIIDSTLNLNSYNLGLDGTPFVPQKLQYELYEKYNTPPKMIIQIIDFGALGKAEGDLYNYIKFAPYLNLNLVQETTKLYNGFSTASYYLPFLKYSGKPLEVTDGILSTLNIHFAPSKLQKGYFERDIPWDGTFEKFKTTYKKGISKKPNAQTCKLFEEYLANCKQKNITVFLVHPPVYHEYLPFDLNRKTILEYLNTVSKKYDMPFMDYSDNSISLHKKYFYNSQHLNKQGAELFTQMISDDIKEFTEIEMASK